MIILRSLCLLHHASSLDNSTRVVMVDDVSTADFVSTAVRRPSRVDAMLCFGAIFVEAEEPVRFSKRRQSSARRNLLRGFCCVYCTKTLRRYFKRRRSSQVSMNVYNGVITTTMTRKIILHEWMIIVHGWCCCYLHKTSACVWHSYHKCTTTGMTILRSVCLSHQTFSF